MAGRGRASSQKRQKEMARQEKRQMKAQRKLERKKGEPAQPGLSDQPYDPFEEPSREPREGLPGAHE